MKIIYQRVEDVHRACPSHKGDWYFTGDYPTPGGAKVCLGHANEILQDFEPLLVPGSSPTHKPPLLSFRKQGNGVVIRDWGLGIGDWAGRAAARQNSGLVLQVGMGL